MKETAGEKMNKKRFNVGPCDFAMLFISAFLCIGINSLFKPCEPKADGSWMACHWAGQALKAFSLALFIISLIHFLISEPKIKAGLSFAVIPVALFSAIIPGGYIKLCMAQTMRCHSITRPATIVLSVLLILSAVIDIIRQSSKAKKE